MDGTKNSLLETWKDLPGHEGEYQVSNLGRVRSIQREICNRISCRIIPERILKLSVHNNGYQTIHLRKEGRRVKYFIHRIVAMAFLPREEIYIEVNHKDKNRLNNTLENLEWCTHLENCEHRDRTDEPF